MHGKTIFDALLSIWICSFCSIDILDAYRPFLVVFDYFSGGGQFVDFSFTIVASLEQATYLQELKG
jgi:hypothetical protein